MNAPLSLAIGVGLLGALLIGSAALIWRQRQRRRALSWRQMHALADQLEQDLKACRDELDRAYALITSHPGAHHTEQHSREAIDGGLRSLLRQRIWMRDSAAGATQRELDRVVESLGEARQRLIPLRTALSQAHKTLNQAMHQHLPREQQA